MTLSAIPIRAEEQSAASLYAQDVVRHRAVLNELIEIGADMARLVHQQAKGAADAAPGAGDGGPVMAALAGAFEQIARAVRRSVALVRRLAEPVMQAEPARPRIAARARIIRAVEDAIDRRADAHEVAGLQAELHERLDSPDLDDEIGDRPVAEIIVEICRDLGLADMPGTRPWRRRWPADLAVLRARAAAVPRSDGARGGLRGDVAQTGAARPSHAPRGRDP